MKLRVRTAALLSRRLLLAGTITLAGTATSIADLVYSGSNYIDNGPDRITYIGYTGGGTATLNDGQTRNLDKYLNMGYNAGGNATVNVSGTGTHWILAGTLYGNSIGRAGSATINLSDHGKMTLGSVFIGTTSGGSGTLNVSSSAEFISSSIGVGSGIGGTGTLLVQSGGIVTTNGGSSIGAYQGTNIATATITGENSRWNGTGGLQLDSNASLTVAAGGQATFGGELKTQGSSTSATTVSIHVDGTGSLLSAATASILSSNTSPGTTQILLTDGGKLRVGGSFSINRGNIKIGNGGAAGTIDAAAISGGQSGPEIEFNHNESDYIFANDAGTGVRLESNLRTRITSGTTTFTAMSGYSGGTTITGGTLILANPISGTGSNGGGNDPGGFSGSGAGTGAINIGTEGTLQVGNGGTGGTLWTSATITNNGKLVFDRSIDFLFNNPLTGTGDLIKNGPATLKLIGTNTAGFSGSILLNSGAVDIMGAAASGTGTIVFNGGTLISNTGIDFSSRFSNAANQQYKINVAANTTYASALTSVGGSLTVANSGLQTLTLSGNNSYTGGTHFISGRLNSAHDNAFGTGAVTIGDQTPFSIDNILYFADTGSARTIANDFHVTGTADVEINSSQLSFTGTLSNPDGDATLRLRPMGNVSFDDIAIGSASSGVDSRFTLALGQLSGGNVSVDINGAVSDAGEGAGTLVIDSVSPVTFHGVNTHTGGTELIGYGQNVTIAAGASLSASTADLRADNGNLTFNNTAQTVRTLSGSTYGTNLVLSSGHTFTTDTAANSTFAGRITGDGSFVKSGTGALTLTHNLHSYTGTTTINGGKLIVNGVLPTVSLVGVNSGGQLSGNGRVGAVVVGSGGSTYPGDPQILTAASITYQAGSSAIFAIETDSAVSPLAGTHYDRINITSQTSGALTIEEGAALELNFTTDSLAFLQNQGESYTSANYFLFTTTGTGTTTGGFSTLTIHEGGNSYTGTIDENGVATIDELSLRFNIGYTGRAATNSLTGGQDVTFTATVIPEPGTAALLLFSGAAFLATSRRRSRKDGV